MSDPLKEIEEIECSILKASEMEPGFLYLTCKSRNQYKCKVHKKFDPIENKVELIFWEGKYQRNWLSCFVSLDYPVKKLDIDVHDFESRMILKKQDMKGLKRGGLLSGMGMMECWGLYFRKFINVIDGRSLIIESMINEFPEAKERIIKWVDSYKSYYNMGKLPGCIKQSVKSKWLFKDPLKGLE